MAGILPPKMCMRTEEWELSHLTVSDFNVVAFMDYATGFSLSTSLDIPCNYVLWDRVTALKHLFRT